MLSSGSHKLLSYSSSYIYKSALRLMCTNIQTINKRSEKQMMFLKSSLKNDIINWEEIKEKLLNIQGNINKKNYNGILFRVMTNLKKFDAAKSFADHLRNTENELNLGSINGLLGLYWEMGKECKLLEEEKDFILNSYIELYKKFQVLDYTTCERLLHALCAINEWKKGLKVLDDIKLSNTPSHSAYSTLIALLFKNNNIDEAVKLIERSVTDKRALQDEAYTEWIRYIFRNYKDKKLIVKHLADINSHISRNCVTVSEVTAKKILKSYKDVDWIAHKTNINKQSGQCAQCQQNLECLKLTQDEFKLLEDNVKDKLIVGSDLFLKSSPEELKRFMKFVENTGPFDVIIDALNIVYAVTHGDKLGVLTKVVKYFESGNKKILLLGRKHMLRWNKQSMQYLMSKTSSFFTDDLTQDDPYFITAAILSGPNTDLVSKDLLRGHRFVLKEEKLRLLFQRWQWQHQWMVFLTRNNAPMIRKPLTFTPAAQEKNGVWHIPYAKKVEANQDERWGQVNDGIPDLTTWLCLSPK